MLRRHPRSRASASCCSALRPPGSERPRISRCAARARLDRGARRGVRVPLADGRPERLPDLAVELAALKPNVIYALGGDVAPSAKQATRTIPIVAVVSNDPVDSGLVASLAHPGGNVTGLTFLLSDLAAKRLEMVREVMPESVGGGRALESGP